MPNFPSRNFTLQYISTSYQDVTQRYAPVGDSNEYLLDALGNVIVSIPSTSIGYSVITSDVTSSLIVYSSSFSTLAQIADIAIIAETASIAVQSDFAISSSWASSSISSSYAVTMSYINTINYITSGSWASSSLSASYSETSSWALSAISSSWAPPTPSDFAISASWASASLSSSYALSASWSPFQVSSSYSDTASFALNGGGTTLDTGSTYPITSSWAENSVYVISSSWASSSFSSSYSETASFSISSSYAISASSSESSSYSLSSSYAESSSYALNSDVSISSSWASSSFNAEVSISSSWASSSFSSSYAETASFSSYTDSSSYAFNSDIAISSSWASQSLSASWAPPTPSDFSISASWASASLSSSFSETSSYALSASWTPFQESSSYAVTASFALNGGGSGTTLETGSTYPITSSWAESASWAPNLYPQTEQVSASWASQSLSASYAPDITSYTSSLYGTASWANKATSASYALSSSYVPNLYPQTEQISSSWASSSLSASYAPDITNYTSSLFGTASWANNSTSASYALSASWAPDITSYTSSLYGTASWAENATSASYALSSSYVPNLYPQTTQVSASWASASLSSSHAILTDTASFVNLALGAYIQADTSSSEPPWEPGRLFWDNVNHTYAIFNDQSAITLQIGQGNYIRVIAGEALGDGKPVYILGSIDPYPIVYLAQADAFNLKSGVVGLTTQTISSGSQGWITTQGRINGLNTLGFSNGGAMFLGTTTGSLSPFPPGQPYPTVLCGYCVFSDASSGKILVNVVGFPPPANAYAGITTTVTIANNNNGTITVSTGSVNLYADPTGVGAVSGYSLESKTFSLVTGSTNYIVAEHSASLASYTLTTDSTYANGISIVRVAILDIYTAGGTQWDVHQFNIGIVGLALANRTNNKDILLYGYQRQDGLTLFTTGSTGLFGITNGNVWYGPNSHVVPTFDTTLGGYYTYIFATTSSNGTSSWSQISQSKYISGYYDSGSTGLTPCTPNSWSVNYVYRLMGTDDEAAIVMSNAQFATSLEASSNATTPSNLPTTIVDIGLLVGRFIVQSGSFSPSIESAFSNVFIPATVTNHESLLGLQGGQGGEHEHLTAAEYLGTGTGVFVKSDKPSFVGATIGHIPYWNASQQLTLTGSVQVYGNQYVLINSGSPDLINPEALLVKQDNTSSVLSVGSYGTVDNFFQVYNQNFSSKSEASTDICATADIGNQDVNFIDMGIGSSGYASVFWPWVKALDGYIQMHGGDLWMALLTDNSLRFAFNNTASTDYADKTGFYLSGSFFGTASWSNKATSASYALSASYAPDITSYTSSLFGTSSWAVSASFSTNALTASYVTASNVIGTVTSASYALSASWAPDITSYTSSLYGTASWANNATSASYAPDITSYTSSLYGTSSWSSNSISASYALSASWAPDITSYTSSLFGTASWSNNATSASYALSASYSPGGSVATYTSSLFGTASWSNNSLTASYITASNIIGTVTSASYFPYGRSVMLCSAYTPTATGEDAAEVSVPFSPLNGGNSTSWTITRLSFRVKTAAAADSSVIDIEKSTDAGAFSATLVGSVTLNANSYENNTTGSLGTVNSGDKLRFNVTTLGTATNWTVITEISNT